MEGKIGRGFLTLTWQPHQTMKITVSESDVRGTQWTNCKWARLINHLPARTNPSGNLPKQMMGYILLEEIRILKREGAECTSALHYKQAKPSATWGSFHGSMFALIEDALSHLTATMNLLHVGQKGKESKRSDTKNIWEVWWTALNQSASLLVCLDPSKPPPLDSHLFTWTSLRWKHPGCAFFWTSMSTAVPRCNCTMKQSCF